MARTIHHKLVRDNVPDIIRAKGITVKTQTLSPSDVKGVLWDKLLEESSEAAAATPEKLPEEIADVLEVLQAIAKYADIPWQTILKEQRRKREERGGFTKGKFLEYTEEPKKKSEYLK